jgi:hypothetical protein
MQEEMLGDQEDDGRIVFQMEEANKKPSMKQLMMIIVMMLIVVALNQLRFMDGLPSTERCPLVYSPYTVTATREFFSYGREGK